MRNAGNNVSGENLESHVMSRVSIWLRGFQHPWTRDEATRHTLGELYVLDKLLTPFSLHVTEKEEEKS
jgi:hypothetical protein